VTVLRRWALRLQDGIYTGMLPTFWKSGDKSGTDERDSRIVDVSGV
jgi:hypothetical protein